MALSPTCNEITGQSCGDPAEAEWSARRYPIPTDRKGLALDRWLESYHDKDGAGRTPLYGDESRNEWKSATRDPVFALLTLNFTQFREDISELIVARFGL
jgi:hypothetical protein